MCVCVRTCACTPMCALEIQNLVAEEKDMSTGGIKTWVASCANTTTIWLILTLYSGALCNVHISQTVVVLP